jgi:hypothetical protein
MQKLFSLQFPKETRENQYIDRNENAPVTFRYAAGLFITVFLVFALFYLFLFFGD